MKPYAKKSQPLADSPAPKVRAMPMGKKGKLSPASAARIRAKVAAVMPAQC